jgi:hypothetical protein
VCIDVQKSIEIIRSACGATRIPFTAEAFAPPMLVFRFAKPQTLSPFYILTATASQRCSGMLSQLLKIVSTTSSFGDGSERFAAAQIAGRPSAAGGTSPMMLAPRDVRKQPTSSPVKPSTGFYK